MESPKTSTNAAPVEGAATVEPLEVAAVENTVQPAAEADTAKKKKITYKAVVALRHPKDFDNVVAAGAVIPFELTAQRIEQLLALNYIKKA